MDIKVDYIKTPVEKIKVVKAKAGSAGGKIGGKAKVPKGFAKMDKDRLKELSRNAINKRWGR